LEEMLRLQLAVATLQFQLRQLGQWIVGEEKKSKSHKPKASGLGEVVDVEAFSRWAGWHCFCINGEIYLRGIRHFCAFYTIDSIPLSVSVWTRALNSLWNLNLIFLWTYWINFKRATIRLLFGISAGAYFHNSHSYFSRVYQMKCLVAAEGGRNELIFDTSYAITSALIISALIHRIP